MALGIAMGIAFVVVGLALGAPLGLAVLRGEPLFGMKAGRVAELRPGNALLCGHVEPAWSYLRSPVDDTVCVYYDTLATVAYGRDRRTIFHRRNAVPFILNDGTGRVPVMARHAMWDLARGGLDQTSLWSEAESVAEAESAGEVRALLDRKFAEPPAPLWDERDTGYSDDDVRRFATEKTLSMGEMVTVVGAVAELPRTDADQGVGDDGTALGLPGGPVIAGRGIGPVSVLVGTPDQIARRVRLRIGLAALGLVIALAGAGIVVMFATTAS